MGDQAWGRVVGGFIRCWYFEFYLLSDWKAVVESEEKSSRHKADGNVDGSGSSIHDRLKGLSPSVNHE